MHEKYPVPSVGAPDVTVDLTFLWHYWQKENTVDRRFVVLTLTYSQVKESIEIKEAIDIVGEAFAAYSCHRVEVPVRTQIKVEKHSGTALFMPGYVEDLDSLGVKIVSVFPENEKLGKNTINALVIINDAETGEVKAVMEGGYLTALRTAAASGAATRVLAREDAESLAIIGAGTQGRTQLQAICEVRPIRKVYVYDVSRERLQSYIDEIQNKVPSVEIMPSEDADGAVEKADIVVTATTSYKPVFAASSLRKGAHINAIGAFTPQMQEIGEDTICRANLIVVDSIEAVFEESGDIIIPWKAGKLDKRKDIHGELGEIISGRKRGRKDNDEITLFKTVGISVQDISVAQAIYERAQEKNMGQRMDLMK